MLLIMNLIGFILLVIIVGSCLTFAWFLVEGGRKQVAISLSLFIIAIPLLMFVIDKTHEEEDKVNQSKVAAVCKSFGGVDLESKSEGTEAIMFLCNEGPKKIQLVEK